MRYRKPAREDFSGVTAPNLMKNRYRRPVLTSKLTLRHEANLGNGNLETGEAWDFIGPLSPHQRASCIRRRIVRQSRHGESSARACHLLQMFPPSNSAVQVHGNPPSPVPSYINRGFNVKSTMVIAEESELYAPRDLFAVPMTMSLCPFSHWFV
ncbi:hypothetical protein CISG_08496 [Coccidioides immitis RMSCC 3703]|uniref:Uncharacterized protein n=1 Tax=Coccidioides immitis RMSCC 3703 TaxID=454286 RepID=A0A0J8R6Y8_COCIT|nr:hypothetical protein CISG_08496 [Coccidioides immitis RMSCC 3703]